MGRRSYPAAHKGARILVSGGLEVLRRLWPDRPLLPRAGSAAADLCRYRPQCVTPIGDHIGVGIGTTAATDHLIVKGILGRRFDWGRHSAID